MVGLYKDPQGKRIFEDPTEATLSGLDKTQTSMAVMELFSSDQQKVEWLMLRVQELEKEASLSQVSRHFDTRTEACPVKLLVHEYNGS